MTQQLARSSATKIGQATTDTIGFYGVTVYGVTGDDQLTATTAPAATAATSSTPYGYSQAQADAIVTWIRAVDAHLKALGLIAS